MNGDRYLRAAALKVSLDDWEMRGRMAVLAMPRRQWVQNILTALCVI